MNALLVRRAAAVTRLAPSAARSFSSSVAARGGDHHGPVAFDPPFHRLPKGDRPLHEQDELIWNDGVAPETAIDFDVPHWSANKGLVWWLGGFGFFASVFGYAVWTDQPNNKISASRDLPESTKTTALGSYAHGKY